jgi:hypothetical protein
VAEAVVVMITCLVELEELVVVELEIQEVMDQLRLELQTLEVAAVEHTMLLQRLVEKEL